MPLRRSVGEGLAINTYKGIKQMTNKESLTSEGKSMEERRHGHGTLVGSSAKNRDRDPVVCEAKGKVK